MSIRIIEPVNVRSFGAIGDGVNDDTQSFLDALALLHTYDHGVLYCPPGTYKINQQLEINNPYIGIKGDGMDVSILKFDGSGILLCDGADVTRATIEEISIIGNGNASSGVPGTGTGITMPEDSNFYFLNKFFISDFDIAIDATKSMLSKVSNFMIQGCRIGIKFSGYSYGTTISYGTVRGCRENGIIDDSSGIYISYTDVEGIYGTEEKPGIAILGGYGMRIANCHIEINPAEAYPGGIGIGIYTAGGITVENSFISCENGVKQIGIDSEGDYILSGTLDTLYGSYQFRNIKFASSGMDIDAYYLINYEVEDCTAGITNLNPLYGYIKNLRDITNQGTYISYTTPGIEINGVPVMKGHKVVFSNVPFGIIPANTTNTNIVTLPSGTPFELSSWDDTLVGRIMYFTVPAGIIFRLNVVEGSTDQIAIYTTNTTSSAIDLDTTKYFMVNVIKNTY